MTREEALYSYTLANAIAQFEEKQKGSIEVGKFADLVLLSNDLVTCKEEDIPSTQVLMTVVGGKILYEKK
jgi:predicted amidohydrolase YtcJ